MREGLENVARGAVRVAGGAAQQAVRLAGTGARYAGGVAESCLARAGVVGRRGVTEVVRDTDDTGRGPAPAPTVAEPSIEDAAAEAVARQEARAAADAAAQARRRAALAEDEDDDIRTPSGIPAADEGFNPDTDETDLVQPDTADPTDAGTLHAIESEAETLRAAARRGKS